MARLIDQEYDSAENLIAVTIEDDGYICEFERVRYGRWLDCENYNDIAQCSECGLVRNIHRQEGWNYCPNCGAKMSAQKYVDVYRCDEQEGER